MAITEGNYKARAVGEAVLGESGNKKTPFLQCYFEILEGENKGGRVRWTGYFSDNTSLRTIESLQHAGWQGEDLAEFSDGALHGIDANEVEIVVELEEYEKDGEKKTAPRVAWVNRAGGHLFVDNAMTPEAASVFGEKMKGLVLKSKDKLPKADASFNFGANATPKSDPSAEPRKSF